MRFSRALGACLLTLALAAPNALAQDGIELLPLGDPDRAYELASGLVGETVDCRAGETIDFDALIDDLADADVVILGERHTSMDVHQTQARIVRALAGRRPARDGTTLAIAMEFFDFRDDDALSEYAAGAIDLPQLVERTDWYERGGYAMGYYAPILEVAPELGCRIVGANVPRDWVRAFSRGTADTLDEAQLARFGPPGVGHTPRTSYMFARMIGDDTGGSPMLAMVERGQEAWDRAMGTSVLRALDDPDTGQVVLIVGSGHASHALGIPEILAMRRPDLRVRTIMPAFADPPDPDAPIHPGFEPEQRAAFSRGYADFVCVFAEDGGAEAIPTLGISLAKPDDQDHDSAAANDDGGFLISRVSGASIGERAGVRHADALLAINGKRPASRADAVFRLRSLEWDTRVELLLRREGRELVLPVLVTPTTDGTFDWLASEPVSLAPFDFDPTGDAVVEPVEPAGRHVRLVTHMDRPYRADVIDDDGSLREAWRLDEHGRPVLGLLRSSAGLGVRVEIERDEDGGVAMMRWLRQDGSVVAEGDRDDAPTEDGAK